MMIITKGCMSGSVEVRLGAASLTPVITLCWFNNKTEHNFMD